MKFLTAWNNNRKTVQVALGLLSLFALLLYTFWHTGGLLSHYISPGWMGRVAAFGVEVAIVSMSLRIGELGWTAPNAKPYKWTLGLTLAVSAFANLAEGHATKYGTELTVNAVPNIDVIQGVIGVAATALLSIVVYLLADIIGGDVQRAEQQAEQPEQQAEQQLATPEQALNGDALVTWLVSNPAASYQDIAKYLGVSRSTAYNRVDRLIEQGVISKNGHGWEQPHV